MSFFSGLSRLFGFGPNTDDDDTEYTDDTTTAPTATAASDSAPASDPAGEQQEMTRRIFDKVVEIVNASLPDFLAKSVDPEKEKQYIFEALDASMREYILSLDDAARQRCQALWQSERDQLHTEMDKLKEQARQLEEKRSAMRERQLSADRQKRALSERVHDLEAQILKLEAEREQLELENKSLINKAKVATVYETELEEMRHRLAEAAAGASATPADTSALEAALKEAEQLKAQVAQLAEERDRLAADAKRMADAHEAAQVKGEMDSAMQSELRKTAAEATARVRELEAQCQKLEEAAALAEAKAADAQAQAEARQQELAAAPSREQLEEIMAHVQRFSDVKDKLDRRIAQLKDTLTRSEKENEQLRDTIKNNRLVQAQREKQLREQLESMRAEAGHASDPEPAPYAESDINLDDTSDIDDVIMRNDFLSSEPMPDRFPTKPKEDPEFGYTPPKKSRAGESDAQMTLF